MSYVSTHEGFGPYGLSDEDLMRILGVDVDISRESMIEKINRNEELLKATFNYPDLMMELYNILIRPPGNPNLLGTRASPQCGLSTGEFIPLTSVICSYIANGLDSIIDLSECNQLSMRLARGMIMSATTTDRRFRPFQEVIINAINGYRETNGINTLPRSGYGFFTLLPLIGKGKLVVSSCCKVSDDKECLWDLCVIHTNEGYKARIHSSIEPLKNRNYTQVSIMLPEATVSYLEGVKEVIRRTFKYVPERITLNNQLINEGFADDVGGLIEVVIDSKIIIVKDSSSGISLSRMFNDLLIPFSASGGGSIDMPAETLILENKESMVVLDVVHNDLVISRHKIRVTKDPVTYYLRLPSSLELSPNRDYVHYRSEKDILSLLNPITKLFLTALVEHRDVTILYDLFKEYVYSSGSKYLVGVLYRVHHEFTSISDVFPVPIEHFRLYSHIRDVFNINVHLIPSEYPRYNKLSKFIRGLPNDWRGKDLFPHKFSILVPGMFSVIGKKVTDGGLIDIYFIDSTLQEEMTTPSIVSRSMGIELHPSGDFGERFAKFLLKYPTMNTSDGFYQDRIAVMKAFNLDPYEMSNYWYHLLDILERLNIKKDGIRILNDNPFINTTSNLSSIQGYIGYYFDTFTKLKLRAFELTGEYVLEDPLSFIIFNKVESQTYNILTLCHPVYVLLISYYFRGTDGMLDDHVVIRTLNRILYNYDLDTISFQLVEYMSENYGSSMIDIIFNEVELYIDIYNKFYYPGFHIHDVNLTFHQMSEVSILLTANQLMHYISRNNVDMNDLSWLYRVGSIKLPEHNTLGAVEYAVSRNSNYYGVAFINETVKNTILNFGGGHDKRYDFQVGKYGGEYSISARDYIGLNSENLISMLIPFLTTNAGFGIGLMTIFRSPYAKTVYISTRDPINGYFYEVVAVPVVHNDVVIDIKYQISVSLSQYPESARMTEITASLNDIGDELLVDLLADSLIHSNFVLPYMSHKAKCTINDKPVVGDTITALRLKSYLGGYISVRINTSKDYIPSLLVVNGKIKGNLLSHYNTKEDWVLSSVSYNLYISVPRNVYEDKRYFDLLVKLSGLLFIGFQIDIPEVNKYFSHNYPGTISPYLKSIGVKGDILDHLPIDDLDDLDPKDPLSIDFSQIIGSMTNTYRLNYEIYNHLPKKEGVYNVDDVFSVIRSISSEIPIYYIKLVLSWFWGKYRSTRMSSRPEYFIITPPIEISEFFSNLIENSWIKAKSVISVDMLDSPPSVYFYKEGLRKVVYNNTNRTIGIPIEYVGNLYKPLLDYRLSKRINYKKAKIYFDSNYYIGEVLSPHGQVAHAFTHALFNSKHRRVDHVLKFDIGDIEYNTDFDHGTKIIWEAVMYHDY